MTSHRSLTIFMFCMAVLCLAAYAQQRAKPVGQQKGPAVACKDCKSIRIEDTNANTPIWIEQKNGTFKKVTAAELKASGGTTGNDVFCLCDDKPLQCLSPKISCSLCCLKSVAIAPDQSPSAKKNLRLAR